MSHSASFHQQNQLVSKLCILVALRMLKSFAASSCCMQVFSLPRRKLSSGLHSKQDQQQFLCYPFLHVSACSPCANVWLGCRTGFAGRAQELLSGRNCLASSSSKSTAGMLLSCAEVRHLLSQQGKASQKGVLRQVITVIN